MHKPNPFVLAAIGTLGLALHGAAGAATYNEGIDGDLSNDMANPTLMDFGVGVHTISGTTIDNPLDPDYFTISVGAGETLNSLILTAFTADPTFNEAFIALDDGGAFESGTDTGTMLGATLIGVTDIGSDALTLLQTPQFGGQGFTTPLGEGEYAVWFQETGGPTSYTFTATIVPEPGSAAALLLGAGGLMVRRRR